jgi:hypothetical protein
MLSCLAIIEWDSVAFWVRGVISGIDLRVSDFVKEVVWE